MNPTIDDFLAAWRRDLLALYPASPIPVDGLWLVPIVRKARPKHTRVRLLAEGLERGETVVRELDGGGQVNTIRIEHRGKSPLLVLQGEEVLGARQNRMFNASLLVPPGASTNAAVSCVEAGRWERTDREFHSSGHTVTSRVRTSSITRVSTSAVTGRGLDADQREVWQDVDRHLSATATTSVSRAHAEATQRRRALADRLARALPLSDITVGVAAVAGAKLVSLDVLLDPNVFGRAWPMLARGLFAASTDEPLRTDARALARQSIDELAALTPVVLAGPDGSATLHARGTTCAAGAVADGEQLHHLAAASV